MSRMPTIAQREAAQARRAKFRELAKLVAAMSPAVRDELASIAGIRTIEGRSLSPFNQCLLLSQLPGVSVVGGFHQWKQAGRRVRKGERGLSLWCPTGRTVARDPSADLDAAGEVGEQEGKSRGGAFIMGTVFDISQTESAELTESA